MTYDEEKEKETWFLDSGCSCFHMCGNKNAFSDLDENFKHAVKLGNNTRMNVCGHGSVKLRLNNITHIVTGVYFIPELKNNLLSLGQLQERGLSINSVRVLQNLSPRQRLDHLCRNVL